MEFTGFGDEAFAFFERVVGQRSWDVVRSWQPEWERSVHLPMEALLDRLGAEFGRDGYAYHLHKDPWLWSHQVGIITVTDTIGYRVVLSIDGLLAEAGWMRAAADQMRRYRAAAEGPAGAELDGLVTAARRSGFGIQGDRLATRPRGVPADHPRLALLAHRTLWGARPIPAGDLGGPGCADAVARTWGELRPLVGWLAEHVGPRDGRR